MTSPVARAEQVLAAMQLGSIGLGAVWSAQEGNAGPLVLAFLVSRTFAALRPSARPMPALPSPEQEAVTAALANRGSIRTPRKVRGER